MALKDFFKHSTVYAAGNVLNRVGSFLLLPLYTRYLSVENFGALELFSVTASLISSLLSVGLAHATLRFYFEYEEGRERGRVVSSCLWTTALTAVPAVLVLSRFNAPLAKFVFDDASLAPGFNLIYATLVLELMRQIGLAYFRAREYSTLYVAVCFVQFALQVSCNVYTVVFRGWGVQGVLAGNLAAVAAGWLFTMAVAARQCGLGFDAAKMRSILGYSYPFLFTAVLGVVMQNFDRVILRAFFSLREVGLYALAFKFGMLLQELLLEPYNRSFGAYRFKIMNQPDAKQVLVKVYGYLMVAVFVAGAAVSLYARDVLRLLTAPAFWEASRIVPWIALAFAVSGSSYTFQTGLLYAKKTKFMLHITLSSSLVTVCLALILVPRLGPYGAALAFVAKALTDVALTYRASQRLYPVDYRIFDAVKALGCAALVVGAGAALPDMPLALSLLARTALVGAFPALLAATGVLSRADLAKARDAVAPWLGRLRPAGA